MNNFNHDQFYGMPDELNQVRYQKYFYCLNITFQIEGETTRRILKQNLKFIPKKPELEKLILDKIERYTHSRRFCQLIPKPIAKLIKYSIHTLIKVD
jgi:hypothetical protein